jgi:hypothetical protein
MEHCFICNKEVPYDPEHYDQRFCIGFCDKHNNVPPAYADKARQQLTETGKTQWDNNQ